METGKCRVIYEELTIDIVKETRENQNNTRTQNSRVGEESALSKALRGSREFLIAQGYIKRTVKNDSKDN